jgi:hypothetical protein
MNPDRIGEVTEAVTQVLDHANGRGDETSAEMAARLLRYLTPDELDVACGLALTTMQVDASVRLEDALEIAAIVDRLAVTWRRPDLAERAAGIRRDAGRLYSS